jgi:hypothetical protein
MDQPLEEGQVQWEAEKLEVDQASPWEKSM